MYAGIWKFIIVIYFLIVHLFHAKRQFFCLILQKTTHWSNDAWAEIELIKFLLLQIFVISTWHWKLTTIENRAVEFTILIIFCHPNRGESIGYKIVRPILKSVGKSTSYRDFETIVLIFNFQNKKKIHTI